MATKWEAVRQTTQVQDLPLDIPVKTRYVKILLETNYWGDRDYVSVTYCGFIGSKLVKAGRDGIPLCEEAKSSTFTEITRLVRHFQHEFAQDPTLPAESLASTLSLLARTGTALKEAGPA